MIENTIKGFCEDHKIRVLDTNKRAHKYHKIDITWFSDPKDYNKGISDFVNYETERVYTIEIAESELEKIAQFEKQVFNHMRAKGHYDMFNYIMEQKEQEKYLRNKYPAVRKAYEQYSLILKMAEGGEL